MSVFSPKPEFFSSQSHTKQHSVSPFSSVDHFYEMYKSDPKLWKKTLKLHGPPTELGPKKAWITPKGKLKKGISTKMLACVYGGGDMCSKHGGDGAATHKLGYQHQFPHVAELGGSTTTPTAPKSKKDKYADGTLYPSSSKLVTPTAVNVPEAPPADPQTPEAALPTSSFKSEESLLGTPYLAKEDLQFVGLDTAMPAYGQLVAVDGKSVPYLGVTTNGNPLVKTPNGFKVLNSGLSLVTKTPKQQHTPWQHATEKSIVAAPTKLVEAMEAALDMKSSSKGGPHRYYFDSFAHNGYHAFIVGGMVRDWIATNGEKVSKDVDLVTDAPYHTVQHISGSKGAKFNDYHYIALCQVGSPNDKAHALDLTCLRSTDQYENHTGTQGGVKLGGTLATDCDSRDFACNALFYDPINKVIHDPTGRGIEDAKNKILSPSYVTEDGKKVWLSNPRLGVRVVKMLMRGYKASDQLKKDFTQDVFLQQMHTFVNLKSLSSAAAWTVRQIAGDLTNENSWGDLNTTTKNKVVERMKQFRQTMFDNGFGEVYKKYFAPALMDYTGSVVLAAGS